MSQDTNQLGSVSSLLLIQSKSQPDGKDLAGENPNHISSSDDKPSLIETTQTIIPAVKVKIHLVLWFFVKFEG